MKKIFLFSFLSWICLLVGCMNNSNADDSLGTPIEDDAFIQSVVKVNTSSADIGYEFQLFAFAYESTCAAEGYISKNSRIVCGYIDNETVDKIKHYWVPFFDVIYADGIDDTFLSYQIALENRAINLEEDNIFLYTFEDKVPYFYENHRLIFVFEIVEMTYVDGKTRNLFAPVKGILENDFYTLSDNSSLDNYKGNKFIYRCYDGDPDSPSNKYLNIRKFDFRHILIEKIDDKDVIQCFTDEYLLEKYPEFYNSIAPAFLAHASNDTTLSYYDYNLVKNILNIIY